MHRWVFPLLLAQLATLGCGYSVVRYGGALGDVKSVSITTLRNDSYEAGVEYLVADALRREFLRRQGVRVVEDPRQADLVLHGSIGPVETASRSFSSVVLSLEYEVELVLELQATKRDGTEVPLDPRALRESERYLAGADIEVMRKNRQEALRQVATVLAGRVYDALYETLTP